MPAHHSGVQSGKEWRLLRGHTLRRAKLMPFRAISGCSGKGTCADQGHPTGPFSCSPERAWRQVSKATPGLARGKNSPAFRGDCTGAGLVNEPRAVGAWTRSRLPSLGFNNQVKSVLLSMNESKYKVSKLTDVSPLGLGFSIV